MLVRLVPSFREKHPVAIRGDRIGQHGGMDLNHGATPDRRCFCQIHPAQETGTIRHGPQFNLTHIGRRRPAVNPVRGVTGGGNTVRVELIQLLTAPIQFLQRVVGRERQNYIAIRRQVVPSLKRGVADIGGRGVRPVGTGAVPVGQNDTGRAVKGQAKVLLLRAKAYPFAMIAGGKRGAAGGGIRRIQGQIDTTAGIVRRRRHCGNRERFASFRPRVGVMQMLIARHRDRDNFRRGELGIGSQQIGYPRRNIGDRNRSHLTPSSPAPKGIPRRIVPAILSS